MKSFFFLGLVQAGGRDKTGNAEYALFRQTTESDRKPDQTLVGSNRHRRNHRYDTTATS